MSNPQYVVPFQHFSLARAPNFLPRFLLCGPSRSMDRPFKTDYRHLPATYASAVGSLLPLPYVEICRGANRLHKACVCVPAILLQAKSTHDSFDFNPLVPFALHHSHLSGASGNLSTAYRPLATLTIGTPGIFLILLFKSRSFVATIYILCFCTLSTMQSSA